MNAAPLRNATAVRAAYDRLRPEPENNSPLTAYQGYRCVSRTAVAPRFIPAARLWLHYQFGLVGNLKVMTNEAPVDALEERLHRIAAAPDQAALTLGAVAAAAEWSGGKGCTQTRGWA
jgi:hypothetical protein